MAGKTKKPGPGIRSQKKILTTGVSTKDSAMLVAVLTKDGDFQDRMGSLAAALGFHVKFFNTAQRFGRSTLKIKPALALIDVSSLSNSEAVPRMLRMASCHVPFIACMEDGTENEDDLYENGFNAIVKKNDPAKRLEQVIRNFLPQIS